MSYDFIAIDFETANSYYDSACSIGIAAMRGGKVVDKFYSLIKPFGKFSSQNIAIHGITPEDVKSAPLATDLLEAIQPYFSPHWPIVAHNAYFDISVLRNSFHIEESGLWYVDTMNLCRPFVDASLSLVNCAEHFGIFVHDHHNALDDAINCALIAQSVVDACNCDTLIEFLAKVPDMKRGWMEDVKQTSKMIERRKIPRNITYPSHPKPSDIVPSIGVDASSPLFGKNVVFTGELSISRSVAMQIAVDAGAVVKSSISRKVDYLIVGKQNLDIVGSDGISTKERKAQQLNIHCLSEEEFLLLADRKQLAEV